MWDQLLSCLSGRGFSFSLERRGIRDRKDIQPCPTSLLPTPHHRGNILFCFLKCLQISCKLGGQLLPAPLSCKTLTVPKAVAEVQCFPLRTTMESVDCTSTYGNALDVGRITAFSFLYSQTLQERSISYLHVKITPRETITMVRLM